MKAMKMTFMSVAVVAAALVVDAAPDPETVFRNPPQSAKTGVWWHWMGCNVSKEGIVKDLDWFKETGIGAATIFGMADVCSPWATKIKNSPNEGLIAFTPEWWKLVRFACEEAEKRGIEIGVHNCPGYTSTGGPWIPPRLSMRELVFNVTNAEAQISLTAHAAFPVQVGEGGPFISFKGLDNNVYYILSPDGKYYNFSGCGNTLNCNHPVVQQMILDSLRYWTVTYHIDGFRFDLASILGRNQDGSPMNNPPLLQNLAFDPILANVKLIAEAWDAGGLYQVGTFPAWNRWAEWNGKYRDDMRNFLKGDLSLFKTWPNVGVEVENVVLVNPYELPADNAHAERLSFCHASRLVILCFFASI